MDETLVGWIFLLAVLGWRLATRFSCTQSCLHCLGPASALLQWYSIAAVGLVLMLTRTFYDIIKYDYIGYDFLRQSAQIEDNIQHICAAAQADEAACEAIRFQLRIPHWLRTFSLLAPPAGILAFVALMIHLSRLIQYNYHKKRQQGIRQPWMLAFRLEWIIIIIGMPIIFVVMAMRALIRVWAVMTGSSCRLLAQGYSWSEVQALEMATYSMDLELAVTFQFYSVYKFGQLCTSFLQNSKYISAGAGAGKRYTRTLSQASILGIYAFVVIGVLRAVFDITVTWLQETPAYKSQADQLEEKVLSKVATIFSFVTVLCIINMMLISKLQDLRDNLGNANLKFTGTRLLLLIAQIQPQVLSAVTVGSPLYENIAEHAKNLQVEKYLERWSFTMYQSKLLHASLLNVECLFVVLLTIIFWRLSQQQRKALMFDPDSPADYMPLAA